MNQPIHILNQMGVMTSFSVAKKVTDEDINKFFSKQKKSGKTEKQIGKMLQDKIVGEIHKAMDDNEIPGLISQQEIAASLGVEKSLVEKIPELNRLVLVIANKIADKNYDKTASCFFINSLVNMLGLTEQDFTRFHRNNKTEGATDEDDYEDGDGDDGEDGDPPDIEDDDGDETY